MNVMFILYNSTNVQVLSKKLMIMRKIDVCLLVQETRVEKLPRFTKLKKKQKNLHSSSHFVPEKHQDNYSHRVTASRSQVALLLQEGQTITATEKLKKIPLIHCADDNRNNSFTWHSLKNLK